MGENGNRRKVNAKEGSRPAMKSKLSTGGLVGLLEPNLSTSGLRVDSNNGLTPILRARHTRNHREGEVGRVEVANSMANGADGK